MDEVLRTLWQVTLGTVGFAWWCVDRVKKADARRDESWRAWLRRPLRDPPPRTDWDAFEHRIARELAEEDDRATAAADDALAARRTARTGRR